jgi:hypothetical protein
MYAVLVLCRSTKGLQFMYSMYSSWAGVDCRLCNVSLLCCIHVLQSAFQADRMSHGAGWRWRWRCCYGLTGNMMMMVLAGWELCSDLLAASQL